MGLDNGLIIKPKTENGRKYLINNFAYLKVDYLINDSYEFAYFRKCWNIRGRMIEYNFCKNGDYCYLTSKDLESIIENVFKYFLNEKNWNNEQYGNSIWEWYIQIEPLARAIKNLKILLEDIQYGEISENDIEIYWYDSY